MLQSHYADLSSAINDKLDAFGSYLVECKFAEQSEVTAIVSAQGDTNNKKATKLLEIVDSRFKTSTQSQSARAFFNKLLLFLANKLKRNDIAQSLVTTYSKSCLRIEINRAILHLYQITITPNHHYSYIRNFIIIYLSSISLYSLDMCIINVYIIALFTLRIQSPCLCESIGRDRYFFICRETNQVRMLVQTCRCIKKLYIHPCVVLVWLQDF